MPLLDSVRLPVGCRGESIGGFLDQNASMLVKKKNTITTTASFIETSSSFLPSFLLAHACQRGTHVQLSDLCFCLQLQGPHVWNFVRGFTTKTVGKSLIFVPAVRNKWMQKRVFWVTVYRTAKNNASVKLTSNPNKQSFTCLTSMTELKCACVRNLKVYPLLMTVRSQQDNKQ